MCLIIIDLKKEQVQGDEVSYQYTKVLIIYSHFAITFIGALHRKQVGISESERALLPSVFQGSKLTFLLGSTGAPNFKKLGAPKNF